MNARLKKILITIGIITIGLFCFYQFARMFGAGSYPYAEYYELNYPEDTVLKAIEKIKEENPNIAGGSSYEDTDTTDYWHHLYFSLDHYIILTWTRPSSPTTTSFAFVSRLGENSTWKDINDDFGYFENRRIKKSFNENIFKKLQAKLERKAD